MVVLICLLMTQISTSDRKARKDELKKILLLVFNEYYLLKKWEK